MTIPPAGATPCSRAARLVTWPTGVYSTRPPVSTVRITTSPIDADARLRGWLALRPEPLRTLPQCLLHAQRRIERALRMVLVGGRRPEHREDPITSGLHDVAVVAAHRVNHNSERRVDNRARLF